MKLSSQTERIRFLKKVLQKFNEENVDYCILRNYEFLLGKPFPVESLDTVVAEKDLAKIDRLLKGMGFQKRKQQFSLKHKAYFKMVDEEAVSFDIQVGGVHWNDMLYLGEEILKNKTKENYFYVPDNNTFFVMLLVHSILGKRYFKKKYQQIISKLFEKIDQKYVLKKLSFIFNKNSARQLMIDVKNYQFSRIKPYYFIFLFLFNDLKKPIIFLRLFLRWSWQRKNPFKIGPLISLVGPDGAGKSTMTKVLIDYLNNQGRKTSLIYTGRGRNHILPITKFGKTYKKKEKNIYGNKQEQLSRAPSLKVKLLYFLAAPIFTLDLYLRYWLRIFPQRVKKKIVITDRYCSDIILMHHVPFFFKKFLLGLFPKPTISILLYNDPKILHQRRHAEPVSELERQMEIFNRFTYSLCLKTTGEKETQGRAIRFVFNKLLRNWN